MIFKTNVAIFEKSFLSIISVVKVCSEVAVFDFADVSINSILTSLYFILWF